MGQLSSGMQVFRAEYVMAQNCLLIKLALPNFKLASDAMKGWSVCPPTGRIYDSF